MKIVNEVGDYIVEEANVIRGGVRLLVVTESGITTEVYSFPDQATAISAAVDRINSEAIVQRVICGGHETTHISRVSDTRRAEIAFNEKNVAYSDRGFAQMFEFDDLFGATVRVVESSIKCPAMWIFVKGGDDAKYAADNNGSIIIGIKQAKELIEVIKWFIKNHGRRRR